MLQARLKLMLILASGILLGVCSSFPGGTSGLLFYKRRGPIERDLYYLFVLSMPVLSNLIPIRNSTTTTSGLGHTPSL
jgi:hypothetical protein